MLWAQSMDVFILLVLFFQDHIVRTAFYDAGRRDEGNLSMLL